MKRFVFHTFWDNTIINGRSFLKTDIQRKTLSAITCIKMFYFLVLFLSVRAFSPYSQFPEWNVLLESERFFKPVWSVIWLKYVDWHASIYFIITFFFLSAIFNLLFWRKYQFIRVLLFVSMFLYVSLISSFGKIDHWMHLMTIASFFLIFMPNTSNLSTPAAQKETLSIFFGIQSFILVTYFISGYFKFLGILKQELRGKISSLDISSLGEFSAMNSYHHNSEYFLTSFITKNESFLFPILLLTGFCLELFAIYALFKPKYHRIVGLLIILLHSAILIIIGPDFTIQILVVGVFILFSPFGLELNLSSLINEVFAFFKKLFSAKTKLENVIVFYDGDCITCNRFLQFISKFDLPENTGISTQDSQMFLSLAKEFPDLNHLDTIIIVENHGAKKQHIRLKADAITWFLAKTKTRFKILRCLYFLFPLPSNLIYDIVAVRRKKVNVQECLLPPLSLRKFILD